MKKYLKLICIFLLIFLTFGCNNNSSEKKLDVDNYKSLVEISIDDKPDFMLIINKSNNIDHIFFLNEYSKSLYNQNIEGKSIEDGMKILMQRLWEENSFNVDDSVVKLINYRDLGVYETIKSEINKNFVILGINGNVIELGGSISEVINDLGYNYKDDKTSLEELDKYSKKVINK